MPRSAKKVPAYCRHKASGRAVVRIDGRDEYLGPYGSPESHERYQRLVAEWRARREEASPPAPTGRAAAAEGTSGTVAEVLLAYLRFAEGYYVKDGEPTDELENMKLALRPVNALYGRTRAAEFGPLALKAVREHMIRVGDLCRTEVNKRVGRIKRAFRWAASEELVPAAVDHGLRTVAGLKKGRCQARESEPVTPVCDDHVEAVLRFVSPPIAAMIRLERLTGMRPGEVVQMRPCDVDRSGDVWVYEPAEHKNEWRGHSRFVPLGPRAQEVLRPFLDRPDDVFCFSPREAEEWRYATRPTAASLGRPRTTKIYPSELRARERRKRQRRTRERKRPLRERYDAHSYGRAITYAVKLAAKAGVEIPHWSPNRLRHARATELRKLFGIEAAQVTLGHARADVTQIYAERNLNLAIEVAAKTG